MGEEWVDLFKDGAMFVKKNSEEHMNGKIRFQNYQNLNNLSLKHYTEVNCNEQSFKHLNTLYFSQEHLKGELLRSDGPGDKVYPPPDSYIGVLIRLMCKSN